jgi:hypothetical protein
MPVQQDPIEIPFVKGPDTKIDPKLVEGPVLLALNNGVVDEQGRIRARPGTALVTSTTQAGVAVTGGGELLAKRQKQLVVLNGTMQSNRAPGQVYALTEANDRLRECGSAKTFQASSVPLVTNSAARQWDFDYFESGNFGLLLYSEIGASTGDAVRNLFLTVWDTSNGEKYQERTLLSGPTSNAGEWYRPRLIGTSGFFYMTATGGALIFRAFNTASPHTVGAPVTVVAGVNAYDACVCASGGSYVAYQDGGGWHVIKVDANGAITGTSNAPWGGLNPTDGTTNPPAAILELASGDVIFATNGTVSGLIVFQFSSAPVYFTAGVVDGTTTAKKVHHIGLAQSATPAVIATAWDTVSDGVFVAEFTAVNPVMAFTTSPTLWGPNSVAYGTGAGRLGTTFLAGLPFYGLERALAVPVVFRSATQPTFFLLRGQFEVHARFLSGSAFYLEDQPAGVEWLTCHLPQVVRFSGVGTRRLPLLVVEGGARVPPSVGDAASTSPTAIRLFTFGRNIDPAARGLSNSVEYGAVANIAGAVPTVFDGTSQVERDFHLYPEAPTGTILGGGGPGLSAGKYQWVTHYEWTDEEGQLRRSAPSLPLTMTVAANDIVRVTVRNLRFTDCHEGRGRRAVRIVLSRTTVNGSVFYRMPLPALDGSFRNFMFAASSFYDDDGNQDSEIISGERLYTTGGVLENEPFPACSFIAEHQGRLFGISAEADEIAYTQTQAAGLNSECSTAYRLRAPAEGGALTALATLDDVLVVFRERRTYLIQGQGPNVLGVGATYSDAQPMAGEIGCVDPRSVVSIPQGIIFRAATGFHLLNRARDIEYIGGGIEGTNFAFVMNSRVLSAVHVDRLKHIRFILANGSALVFNYEFGVWSTWPSYFFVDGLVAGGNVYLLGGGEITTDSAEWDDRGARIDMTIDTAWVKVGGLVGLQRVKWVGLLVEALTRQAAPVASQLNVSVYTDYNETPVETVQATFTSGVNVSLASLLRHKPNRQKCTSMRLRLVVVPGSRTRVGLTAMRFNLGSKRGPKLDSNTPQGGTF